MSKILPQDYSRLAGTWQKATGPADSDLAKRIPADAKLIVGGRYAKGHPGEFPEPCFLCNCRTWLSPKDRPILAANPGMVILCSVCLTRLQGVE